MTKKRAIAIAAQVVVWLGGLGAVGYFAYGTFTDPQTLEQLQKLREATVLEVTALLGLCAGTVLINALLFKIMISPVRRLKFLDLTAVNWVATVLNNVPPKLGAIMRFAYHNRRDRIPLLEIGAWFAAFGVVTLSAVIPIALASTVFRGVGAGWTASVVAGPAICGTAAWAGSRAFAGPKGRRRLRGIARATGQTWALGLMRTKAFANLHAGLTMLAHGKVVAAGILVRASDLALASARFWIASEVLGLGLTFEDALLLGTSYFMIQVISPAGTLGVREAGAIGVGTIAGMGEESVTVVTLLVTVAETLVLLLGVVPAMLWMKAAKGAGPPADTDARPDVPSPRESSAGAAQSDGR